MDAFLALIIGLILVGLVVIGAVTWDSYECDAKWSSLPHSYGLVQGCMVQKDGMWVPAENVRVL